MEVGRGSSKLTPLLQPPLLDNCWRGGRRGGGHDRGGGGGRGGAARGRGGGGRRRGHAGRGHGGINQESAVAALVAMPLRVLPSSSFSARCTCCSCTCRMDVPAPLE